MREIIRIIPSGLYLFVSAISLIMAYKNIFSSKLLPFHEKAAGTPWDKIDKSLQCVVIALMRVSGLGFLVIAALLMISSIINYFTPHTFMHYAIPSVATLYCTGLFLVNYALYKNTKTPTPWKGSLYVVLILLLGIAISSI